MVWRTTKSPQANKEVDLYEWIAIMIQKKIENNSITLQYRQTSSKLKLQDFALPRLDCTHWHTVDSRRQAGSAWRGMVDGDTAPGTGTWLPPGCTCTAGSCRPASQTPARPVPASPGTHTLYAEDFTLTLVACIGNDGVHYPLGHKYTYSGLTTILLLLPHITKKVKIQLHQFIPYFYNVCCFEWTQVSRYLSNHFNVLRTLFICFHDLKFLHDT